MKSDRRSVAAIALTAIAAVCFAGLLLQRPALAELRARVQTARSSLGSKETQPVNRAAPARQFVPPRPAGAETASESGQAPLTAAERVELMELRSRVTDLRGRQRALAGLSQEAARLRARLTQMSNYARGQTAEGYVRRDSARQQGQATPEAAIETFFWALEHRDAPTLLALLPDGERLGMERMLAARGSDAFFKEMPALPGYRVVTRREAGPDEVVLELQVGPQKPWSVTMRRETGIWRMHQ